MITTVAIPGNQTSPIRIGLGEAFTENTFSSADLDAIGIDLVAGQTYRITLDPADESVIGPSLLSLQDPYIVNILASGGGGFGIQDDDSGSGLASVLTFTPTVTDTYFIVVGSASNSGWWTLEVNEFDQPADDFTNALDASNAISLGDTQDGHIGFEGDVDTIALSLDAGVAVDITLYGNDVGFFGELADTEIVAFVDDTGTAIDPGLYETADAFGAFITGSGVDAHQITFTPTVSGDYFLRVGAGPGEAIGDYSVTVSAKDRGVHSVRETEKFVATGNIEVDVFFLENFDEDDDIVFTDRNNDGTTTLTYSVPGANPGFSSSEHNVVNSSWANGFAPATGGVLEAWEGMIDYIESFSNIDFVEVPDTGDAAGTMRIGTTEYVLGSASGALVTGWAGAPGWTMAGETWINLTKAAENVGVVQNYGATGQTLDNWILNRTMHEFGHAFGLNHPDFSDLASGVDQKLLGIEYTIMSRAGSGLFPSAVTLDMLPQTLMWMDIQAIQGAYGLDTVTTGGDDNFVFSTAERHFRTVWDAGGRDKITLTGSGDIKFNLKPGTWQDIGTTIKYYSAPNTVLANNKKTVFIAPDTLIEELRSGGGDDEIIGNEADNWLSAVSGEDTIWGKSGDDTVIGGRGDDLLFGNSGDDSLQGEEGADDLRGGSGNDTLESGDENDFLRGNSDQDQLLGGNGEDTLDGGTENDTLWGDGGNDTLNGRLGRDELNGGSAADSLRGHEGGDTLNGDSGNDTLYGNPGNDTVSGGANNDDVRGGLGHDLVEGGTGNDTLRGNSGDDTLDGGTGTDRLIGGSGNDIIRFELGNENDTIADFVAGAASNDVIELSGFGAAFDEFSEVQAVATDDGNGNTIIDFGGGDILTLEGVASASLHADDFAFV